MNIDKLMQQFPELYHSALLQYQIHMHNDLIQILVGKLLLFGFIVLLAVICGIRVYLAKRNIYSPDWLDFICFVIFILGLVAIIVGILMWATGHYDYWNGTKNPTLYIWQELMPQNNN